MYISPQNKLTYASIILYAGAPIVGILVSLFAIIRGIWQEPISIALLMAVAVFLLVCGSIAIGYYLSEKASWAFYGALAMYIIFCITLVGLPFGGFGIYFLLDKDVQSMF
jgi:hypothetical protein